MFPGELSTAALILIGETNEGSRFTLFFVPVSGEAKAESG